MREGERVRERVWGKQTEGSHENRRPREDVGLAHDGGGEGSDDGGEWQLVQYRRRKAPGSFKGKIDIAVSREREVGDIVSFYFLDFPSSHGAKEMIKAFALFGRVVEVVIPPKKNKWGKRFGFVRFTDVKDPRLFAVKLDNIIFGSDKIHVNIPRFGRENHSGAAGKIDVGKREERAKNMKNGIVGKEVEGRTKRIWKEVVKGNKEGDQPKNENVGPMATYVAGRVDKSGGVNGREGGLNKGVRGGQWKPKVQ